MLLLAGGSSQEAWADKTVTYHVITLPFGGTGTFMADATNNTAYRIEAIKKTVTYTSDDAKIELPAEIKSPLMTDNAYTYYADVTKSSGTVKIFPDNDSKYYTYDFTGKPPLTTDATISSFGSYTDVYVTYENWNTKDGDNYIYRTQAGKEINLTGEKEYNIEFNDGSKTWFYALNMDNDRGNRGQAVPSTYLNGIDDLASDDAVKVKQPVRNKYMFFFKWKFFNDDPYNIIMQTAYNGPEFIYKEDGYVKNNTGAQYYGSLESSTKIRNNWVTNEINLAYTNKSDIVTKPKQGWFRGISGEGRTAAGNGAKDHVYFSLTLLSNPKAPYTLVASWVNVNGNDWVPNANGEYLVMQHTPEAPPYAGAKFQTLEAAEQIRIYEVREYTYKLNTHLSGSLLENSLKWSDYGKDELLKDHVPIALKRKYTEITGAYFENTLEHERITFEDVFDNDERTKKKNRAIWLKYSSSMPFEAGETTSTTFDQLKWYNIIADKNTNYTVWYDGSAQFSTHTGHAKFGHESHFAFIGDPYELYVVNRKVCERTKPETLNYLKLADTESDPLTVDATIGADGTIWEMVYDDDKGDFKDCFRLRKFGTYSSPTYIGWQKTGEYPLNGNGDALRLYIEELPLMTYTYYILNKADEVAVKASAEQITGSLLNYESIPEVIRSPFLKDNNISIEFYNFTTKTDFEAKTVANRTQIYYTNSDQGPENEFRNHILVKYTENSTPAYSGLINGQNYNVIVNNDYIFYGGSDTFKSAGNIDEHTNNDNYKWILSGNDPYAMTISMNTKEEGSLSTTTKYVEAANWASGTLTWTTSAPGSKFIVKQGDQAGYYEVMAATGWDVDASATYYNIGRPEPNVVRMYSNAVYEHKNAQIRFQLKQISARQVIYHLIDKADKMIVTESARQAWDEKPQIPAEYFCPLVEKYTYYWSDPRNAEDRTTVAYGDNQHFKDIEEFNTEGKWNTAGAVHVWITYTTSNEVDLSHTTMYVMKYLQGEEFYQEDGADGMTTEKIQAVYPYCNGDGNLNIYGEDMYISQQEGAASTRTRWAWYLQSSGDNDPYHVRILTRQTEAYNGLNRSAYLATMKPSDYKDVVTTLVWPNISGVQSTDYMVLGSDHQYQLVTTDSLEGKRYVVDSFEQYWKTYDTVKKKLLANLLDICEEKERSDRTDGSIEVPETPKALRDRLTGEYGFHSYNQTAYAKRWNGYNAAGEKKKGWEMREHWYQTVKMGSGYFDLIPTTIDPALILLDQHGWEIMRKPLPSGPDDPEKEKKYDVLRQYDSPMVKEYLFWSSAKKRSGYHQYYMLDKRIGGDFTSTSLTSLPPYDSENVKDAKGDNNDQYVTYIVKEEYAKSYVPATTPTAYPFLIRQGNELAKKGEEDNKVAVTGNAGVSQYIIEHIVTLDDKADELWYVKPNIDIDREMGYPATPPDWKDNPNPYEDEVYRNYQTAELIEGASDDAMVKKYGRFTFSNGFDPYNIQISSTGTGTKYFTTGMTGAEVNGGSINGKYGSMAVTLADKNTTPVSGSSYDGKSFAMTNQTFMAVAGADGNIQLMPRFDHQHRLQAFTQLVTPESSADDEQKLEKTYTQLYRPFVYNYLIIDNGGHESLRYRSGGDLLPHTPAHLKSPLAKDFKYYSGLTTTAGVYDLTDISSKEIKASLAGAGLTTPKVANSNPVYVRYAYDEDADALHILKGKWLTMQMNAHDAVYDSGVKEFNTESGTKTKPSPVDGTTDRAWQWKFLKYPYSNPDPYAVQVFNRLSDNQDKPLSVAVPDAGRTLAEQSVETLTDGTAGYYQHFAILSHSDLNSDGSPDTYALALARTGAYNTYSFLNGNGMTTTTAAIITEDKANYTDPLASSGFNSTSGVFHDNDSRVQLFDDVTNDYTYKVYTNDHILALGTTQTDYEASDNGYVPVLPEEARSPLLNLDQYTYYEKEGDMGVASKQLTNLYGLYDNEVFVRYAYDPNKSEYKVPNQMKIDGDIAVPTADSNPSPLKFGEKMLYNIVWYAKDMMKSDGTDIDKDDTKTELEYSDKAFEWRFLGDDPYAIKIQNVKEGKYIHANSESTCDLSDTPTTFMLLKGYGHENGILQVTGDATMLSGYGQTLFKDVPADANDAPNKFTIFALSTLKVVYHLNISNINTVTAIPYRKGARATKDDPETYSWNDKEKGYKWEFDATKDTLHIQGTTKRDLTTKNTDEGVAGDKYQLGETVSYPDLTGKTSQLTTYCYDFGPVSLGDALTVPKDFYRPNVVYSFVIHHITPDAGNTLNNKYKGMEIKSKEMGLDEDLIGKTVYINLVYSFNGNMASNSGDNFVLSLDENKWYTLETTLGKSTYLAQYTNAWGFELKEGRGSHYTNDFLWTPIGDPYGFQLFNRYMDINSGDDNRGEENKVITTEGLFCNNETWAEGTTYQSTLNGETVFMGNYVGGGRAVRPGKTPVELDKDSIHKYSIYELLDGGVPGYFHFHPVANTGSTKYYLNPVQGTDATGTDHLYVRLCKTPAPITFGLSKDLVKPYFDRAGYVGGLKKEVYNAHKTLADAMKDGAEPTAAQLREAQELVYDYKENIVPFKTGYYRLHSPLGISDIDPVRYVSGYTHAIERDLDKNGNESDAIPMHFYEEDSERVRNFTDLKEGGFRSSPATQGDLLILPVDRDPASIFYFTTVFDKLDEVGNEHYRKNFTYIQTQGLYVKGEKGRVVYKSNTPSDVLQYKENAEDANKRAAAVMTAATPPTDPTPEIVAEGLENYLDTKSYNINEYPTQFFVMDIGGGILLIHDNETKFGRKYLKYLSYDHSKDTEGNPTGFDMKVTQNTHTDHAKFCMQPVQNTTTKGVNEMPLKLPLNKGGDGYYYASFYAPYDVLLTDNENDAAYICLVWDTEMLHLKKVGRYNIVANGCPTEYVGSNQFVPAGTPVIIRSTMPSVTMALPTTEPSAALTINIKTGKKDESNQDITVNNIFKGEYLEQLLKDENTGSDASNNDVYSFGLPYKGTVIKSDAYYTANHEDNGRITLSLAQTEETGVGFYINANPNRESGGAMGLWIPNNRYVYNNKIYIRNNVAASSPAPKRMRSSAFIPIVFDEEDDDEPIAESLKPVRGDVRVFDLQGRCMVTEQEVNEGSWYNRLRPGIYIQNGKKFRR